ncbi:MAG: hypothetical protein ACR2OZ_20235 [Verrucomicrobiales bacterium]
MKILGSKLAVLIVGMVIGAVVVGLFQTVRPAAKAPAIPGTPNFAPPLRSQEPPPSRGHEALVTGAFSGRTREVLTELPELIRGVPEGEPNLKLVSKMREVLPVSDESRRTLSFSLLLEAMRREDAPLVAQLFAELKGRGLEFHPEANFFAQRWGELDPEAALQYVVEEGSFERGGVLVDRIMRGWAMHDPKQAVDWVREQPESPRKDEAVAGLAAGWARHDPVEATAFVNSLTMSPGRVRAAEVVFWQILYGQGLEAASAWYDDLPKDPEFTPVRERVFQHFQQRQLQRGTPEADAWVDARRQQLNELKARQQR